MPSPKSRPSRPTSSKAKSTARPRDAKSRYLFKITLDEFEPPIWRRFECSSTLTLESFSHVLLLVMGWEGDHLHRLEVGDRAFGPHEPGFSGAIDDLGMEDESRFRLDQVLSVPKTKLRWEYDFGDGWEHTVILEKILPAETGDPLARCIDGANACPPEDCGGVWGYAELLEILKDPDNPEFEERLEWLGGEFDPTAFDVESVNERLRPG